MKCKMTAKGRYDRWANQWLRKLGTYDSKTKTWELDTESHSRGKQLVEQGWVEIVEG